MFARHTQGRRLTSRIYALGSNGCGQLGVGHQQDLNEPQICQFTHNTGGAAVVSAETSWCLPDNDTVKKLVAGGNHTIILTTLGQVYAAGNNIDGRCGISRMVDIVPIFSKVSWAEGRNVTDVATAWEATFLATDAQTIWACGSGLKGELGLGENVTSSFVPTKVFHVPEAEPESLSILQVRASMGHVVVLLSNGCLYGWGSCRKGQLGPGLQSQKSTWRPQRIELPTSSPIQHVATGRNFTCLVNSDWKPCVLGEFKSDIDSLHPESDGAHTQYESGWSTIYAVSRGKIKGCGQDRRGQLPPTVLPPIAAIAVGSEHCTSLLEDGRVVAWGWGEHGNCGLPLDDRANVVGRYNTILTSAEVGEIHEGVGAGCASSFIWSSWRG